MSLKTLERKELVYNQCEGCPVQRTKWAMSVTVAMATKMESQGWDGRQLRMRL